MNQLQHLYDRIARLQNRVDALERKGGQFMPSPMLNVSMGGAGAMLGMQRNRNKIVRITEVVSENETTVDGTNLGNFNTYSWREQTLDREHGTLRDAPEGQQGYRNLRHLTNASIAVDTIVSIWQHELRGQDWWFTDHGSGGSIASSLIESTAIQTFTGAGTTQVTFDATAVYDDLGIYNSANDRFDITADGKYMVFANFRVQTNPVGTTANTLAHIKVISETPSRVAQVGYYTSTQELVHMLFYFGEFTSGDQVALYFNKLSASDMETILAASGISPPQFGIARMS